MESAESRKRQRSLNSSNSDFESIITVSLRQPKPKQEISLKKIFGVTIKNICLKV